MATQIEILKWQSSRPRRSNFDSGTEYLQEVRDWQANDPKKIPVVSRETQKVRIVKPPTPVSVLPSAKPEPKPKPNPAPTPVRVLPEPKPKPSLREAPKPALQEAPKPMPKPVSVLPAPKPAPTVQPTVNREPNSFDKGESDRSPYVSPNAIRVVNPVTGSIKYDNPNSIIRDPITREVTGTGTGSTFVPLINTGIVNTPTDTTPNVRIVSPPTKVGILNEAVEKEPVGLLPTDPFADSIYDAEIATVDPIVQPTEADVKNVLTRTERRALDDERAQKQQLFNRRVSMRQGGMRMLFGSYKYQQPRQLDNVSELKSLFSGSATTTLKAREVGLTGGMVTADKSQDMRENQKAGYGLMGGESGFRRNP